MNNTKVYVAQWRNSYSHEWCNHTTKAGNALHKTYSQAKKKAETSGGRVITYSLVEEDVEYFDEEVK